MTTRREEREKMRQERLAAQQAAASAEKRRLYLGYAVAGVIVVAIVAGIVVAIAGGGGGTEGDSASDFPELAYIQPLFGAVPDGLQPDGRDGTDPPPLANGDLKASARAANCDLQLNLEDEGATHFTNEDKDQEYGTNPPTSGDHFFSPTETGSGALADGAYLNFPKMVRAVHSLEHGRVEIQYSPDLSEEEQLEIKGVFEESPQGVLMFPNPEMPYEVAITAWRQLAGCERYEGAATLDVLRNFRDIYRGQGPEPVQLAA
jgi:Protein of unknown function (DUF3105)